MSLSVILMKSAATAILALHPHSAVVHDGDTLSGIASSNGVSVAQVEHWNPSIADPDKIIPGEHIRLAESHASSSGKPAHTTTSELLPTPASGGVGGLANAGLILRYLRAHRLSPNAAAGVAGNIAQESGGDPGAVGTGGCGLIGWTPCSVPVGNMPAQLDAVMSYIASNGSVADINAHAATPAEAAEYFCYQYERPGIPMIHNRIAAAEAVASSSQQ